MRTLAVLSAMWQQLSTPPTPPPCDPSAPAQLQRYLLLLSPLVGTLTSPEARQALAAAFVALTGLLPDLATPTRLLTALNRQSESTIGEIDYDSSLAAYSELQKGLWLQLKKNEGLPLMHQCFWDLNNPSDLALRHAAAQVCAWPTLVSLVHCWCSRQSLLLLLLLLHCACAVRCSNSCHILPESLCAACPYHVRCVQTHSQTYWCTAGSGTLVGGCSRTAEGGEGKRR